MVVAPTLATTIPHYTSVLADVKRKGGNLCGRNSGRHQWPKIAAISKPAPNRGILLSGLVTEGRNTKDAMISSRATIIGQYGGQAMNEVLAAGIARVHERASSA